MNKFLLRRLGVADDPAGFKPTLQSCLETVLSQSDAIATDILTGLKALLEQTKVKTHALNPVAASRRVVEDLNQNADQFRKIFSESLRAAVYGGETKRTSAQPLVRFDDFQFLEEEQIDANIEYALTQQEVQMAVEDIMPLFNGMVSTLMGWTSIQPNLNPLKPESFVHALRESLTALVPSEEARATVMTPAAGLMGATLRQLFREICDWLRSQGIEPVLPNAKSGGGFGGAGKPVETSVTRTMLTLDKLRRLLSAELSFDLQPAGNKDFTHTVPASFIALEDMKLVEPMMKRLKERASLAQAAAAQTSGTAGKAAAGGKPIRREKTQSKKLGKELGEEVVRLMLENLMQDRRLLAPVRESLKALEPVLIKMSQIDARFFSERQHPARQFLDKITSRSLAFSTVDEPGYGRFQKALDNAVSVLALGEGDSVSFARVLRKLEDGWQRDEQEQRSRAEESARELLHVEQRNMLAHRLSQEFAESLQTKKLPDMVLAFLRGPWAQVVAESQLRCGDGTVDPDGYKGLVEDLVWSVQPRLTRRNRGRLVELVPGMLVTMRQGLGLISYPPERITSFFDELIAIHEQAFEGARPAADESDAPAKVAHMDEEGSAQLAPDEFWMAEHEATDSGFLDAHGDAAQKFPEPPELPETAEAQDWSTDSLITGSWVDLALGGVWVRAQLTWASPHRTLFMFISGAGLAHSMSRRTMDRLHGLGLIRLISDGRVMDNALDAVAQAALRNDVEKAAGGG